MGKVSQQCVSMGQTQKQYFQQRPISAMGTEQLSHIPPAEGHSMAAGIVCSEHLCSSLERACSLFAIELAETQSSANANSEGLSILWAFSPTVNSLSFMCFNIYIAERLCFIFLGLMGHE